MNRDSQHILASAAQFDTFPQTGPQPGNFPTADVNTSEVTSGPQSPQIVPDRSRRPAPAGTSPPRAARGAEHPARTRRPPERAAFPWTQGPLPGASPPLPAAAQGTPRGHGALGRGRGADPGAASSWRRRVPGPGALPYPADAASPPPGRSLIAGSSFPSLGPKESGAHAALRGGNRAVPGAASPPRGRSFILGRSLIPGLSLPFIPGAQPPVPGAQSPLHPGRRASGADAASRGGHAGRSRALPRFPGGPARSPSGHPAGSAGSRWSRTPRPASPPARRRLHKRGPGGVCPHAVSEPPPASPQPRAAPLRAPRSAPGLPLLGSPGLRRAGRGLARPRARSRARPRARPDPAAASASASASASALGASSALAPRRRPRARRGAGDAATQDVRARAEPSRAEPSPARGPRGTRRASRGGEEGGLGGGLGARRPQGGPAVTWTLRRAPAGPPSPEPCVSSAKSKSGSPAPEGLRRLRAALSDFSSPARPSSGGRGLGRFGSRGTLKLLDGLCSARTPLSVVCAYAQMFTRGFKHVWK